MLLSGILIVAAYLLGSVSTAILSCRLLGMPDPRGVGSGNPGATNVLRHGGNKAAAITLTGDVLKGLLPVALARAFGFGDVAIVLVGLAAFLGHLYPVYYGLKGGKGVATALGVLFGMHWLLGALAAATWLLTALISRISSLSALVAILLAPAYALWITRSPWLTLGASLLTVLVFWRHRSNIRNLAEGTEEPIRGRDVHSSNR